jgi:hypothetical protein
VSGVGDDANPCSRTAPCKTFAGAISKTAAGGIIDALDPGGFGAVTITKSITIDGAGTLASILGAGTNGVNINDGATATPNTIKVTLRNLRIEGAGSGVNGVNYVAGKKLRIEDCVITGFQNGIMFQPVTSPNRLVVQRTTINDNSNSGIKMAAGTGGAASTANRATITDSYVHENGNNGIESTALGTFKSVAFIASTLISDNGSGPAAGITNNGLLSNGASSTLRISNDEITGNGMGLAPMNGGLIISFGNNRIIGNGVDGAPTSTIPSS